MKTLITPSQALRLAFGDGEYLPPTTIVEADIAAAEQRYLVPVLGPALHEKLLAGGYPDFRTEYLAAPVALFTRAMIQPRLDIRTDRGGATAPYTAYARPADAEARRRQRKALHAEARTLLRRAARHLADHRDAFPEYEPEKDILNRCSLDGNLVQTR
ncbi:hypothetical protein [Alistipes sp.]|uniref:DUF6712 family protein n=1 Tax=Alistipes sp. TaxID=1872444 RepID=UPI003AEF2831